MRSLRDTIRAVVRQELVQLLGLGVHRGPLQHIDEEDGGLYVRVAGPTDEPLRALLTEPWGHASRPPTDVELAIARAGSQFIVVGAAERSLRPSLQEGEVALYNATGTVKINAAGDVVLNGGTQRVAREGDSVAIVGTAGPYPLVITSATVSSGAAKVKA